MQGLVTYLLRTIRLLLPPRKLRSNPRGLTSFCELGGTLCCYKQLILRRPKKKHASTNKSKSTISAEDEVPHIQVAITRHNFNPLPSGIYSQRVYLRSTDEIDVPHITSISSQSRLHQLDIFTCLLCSMQRSSLGLKSVCRLLPDSEAGFSNLLKLIYWIEELQQENPSFSQETVDLNQSLDWIRLKGMLDPSRPDPCDKEFAQIASRVYQHLRVNIPGFVKMRNKEFESSIGQTRNTYSTFKRRTTCTANGRFTVRFPAVNNDMFGLYFNNALFVFDVICGDVHIKKGRYTDRVDLLDYKIGGNRPRIVRTKNYLVVVYEATYPSSALGLYIFDKRKFRATWIGNVENTLWASSIGICAMKGNLDRLLLFESDGISNILRVLEIDSQGKLKIYILPRVDIGPTGKITDVSLSSAPNKSNTACLINVAFFADLQMHMRTALLEFSPSDLLMGGYDSESANYRVDHREAQLKIMFEILWPNEPTTHPRLLGGKLGGEEVFGIKWWDTPHTLRRVGIIHLPNYALAVRIAGNLVASQIVDENIEPVPDSNLRKLTGRFMLVNRDDTHTIALI